MSVRHPESFSQVIGSYYCEKCHTRHPVSPDPPPCERLAEFKRKLASGELTIPQSLFTIEQKKTLTRLFNQSSYD